MYSVVHTLNETEINRYSQNINNDRSVIINDDVYYMHGGEFWMQDWEGTTEAVGPK